MSWSQALALRTARVVVFVLLAVPASAPAWSALASGDHCAVTRASVHEPPGDDLNDLDDLAGLRAPVRAGRGGAVRHDREPQCVSTGRPRRRRSRRPAGDGPVTSRRRSPRGTLT